VAPPTLPPAGWYPDGAGAYRWWSGVAWGPADPPRTVEQAGQTMATLAHASYFVVGVVGALVIYLAAGPKNEFVRHHAREALNFQLTFLTAWLTIFIVVLVSFATSPAVGIPFFVLAFFAWALGMTSAVFGMIRAYQGRWWRYPVAIRFVRP
jgi:uncharacterized Tic20 family protein